MKVAANLWLVLTCLIIQQTWAQSGLKGEYYVGTDFERKVFTRIDPAISFSWFNRNPGPGMPKSYYSIRWTGKLLAPATGQYRFFAKVDDGIRVWINNKKVMDAWQLNDSKRIEVLIGLEAGHFYDLRVDYFNDMLEGEIELYWQRPDVKKLFQNPFDTPGEPVPAHFFFQKAIPERVTVIKTSTPPKPVAKPPVLSVSTPSKPVLPKRVTVVKAKPIVTLPLPKKTVVRDTVAFSPAPSFKPTVEPPSDLKPGATFILPTVQFEQSSYILLPESSTELNKLVQTLKANPQWHIHISGHTDNVGDPRLNLALSEQRAKVVANYLIRQGIADERITTEGLGGKQPITDNTTESERSKNRRVEITIR